MLYYIAAFFEIFTFFIFLMVYKNNRDTVLKYLGLFLLFDTLADIILYIMFTYLGKSTARVSNFAFVAQLIMATYILYKFIPGENKRNLKKVLLAVSGIITFLIVGVYIFFNPASEWNYRIRILVGLYLVTLACYYIYKESVSDNLHGHLFKKSGFWIAAWVLVYHTGASIAATLHRFIIQNNISLGGMPLLHFFSAVLSIFSYSFLSVAIILWPKSSSKG